MKSRVSRTKKGLTGIMAGAILFSIIFTVGGTYFTVVSRSQVQYQEAALGRDVRQVQLRDEVFEVDTVLLSNNFIGVTVENNGQSPVRAMSVFVVDDMSSVTTLFDLNGLFTADTGRTSSAFNTTVQYGGTGIYTVKVVTDIGNVGAGTYPTQANVAIGGIALATKIEGAPSPVDEGDTVTVTVTVSNYGSRAVIDALPTIDAPIVTGTAYLDACTGGCPAEGMQDIPAGENRTFTYSYVAHTGGAGGTATFLGHSEGYIGGLLMRSDSMVSGPVQIGGFEGALTALGPTGADWFWFKYTGDDHENQTNAGAIYFYEQKVAFYAKIKNIFNEQVKILTYSNLMFLVPSTEKVFFIVKDVDTSADPDTLTAYSLDENSPPGDPNWITIDPGEEVVLSFAAPSLGSSSFNWNNDARDVVDNEWDVPERIPAVLLILSYLLDGQIQSQTIPFQSLFITFGPEAFYVADDNDNEVYVYSSRNVYVERSFDTGASGNSNPRGISVVGTDIYVLDNIDDQVYRYPGRGKIIPTEVSRVLKTIAGSDLSDPTGMAIDGDELWIVDDGLRKILRYSLASAFSAGGNLNALEEIDLDVSGGGSGMSFDVCTSSTSTSSPMTFSHTIGGGDDRLLVVGIGIEGDSIDVTAVTYNSVALTKAVDVVVGSSTQSLSELWYMLESDLPSTGSYTVSITASYSSLTDIDAGGCSFTGAEQSAPEATASNSNSAQSTIQTGITTLSDGAWIIDSLAVGETGNSTPDGGQTERYDQAGGSSTNALSTEVDLTAGSETQGWTKSGANRLAHAVAAFAPFPPNRIEAEDMTIVSGFEVTSSCMDPPASSPSNAQCIRLPLGNSTGEVSTVPGLAGYYDIKISHIPEAGPGIAFDVCTTGTSSSSPLAFSHTIGGGDDRLLVVGVAVEGGSVDVTSVTYDSTALTKADEAYANNDILVEMWYLLDADLPSSGSYTVSISTSGSISGILSGACSYTGVKQSAPEDTNIDTTTDGETVSTSVTSNTPGAWIIDVVGDDHSGSFSPNGGQTERYDMGSSRRIAGSTEGGGNGLETLGWTHSDDEADIAHVVAVWDPAVPDPDQYVVKLNGGTIDSWNATEGTDNWYKRTIPLINLTATDTLTIEATRGSNDTWAHIDYVDFVESVGDSADTADGLSIDSNYLYVLDDTNDLIVRYHRAGSIPSLASNTMKQLSGADLTSPAGIMFNGTSIWVVDFGTDEIYEYDLVDLFSGSGNINAITEFALDSVNGDGQGL